jgi:hypothetical protein
MTSAAAQSMPLASLHVFKRLRLSVGEVRRQDLNGRGILATVSYGCSAALCAFGAEAVGAAVPRLAAVPKAAVRARGSPFFDSRWAIVAVRRKNWSLRCEPP